MLRHRHRSNSNSDSSSTPVVRRFLIVPMARTVRWVRCCLIPAGGGGLLSGTNPMYCLNRAYFTNRTYCAAGGTAVLILFMLLLVMHTFILTLITQQYYYDHRKDTQILQRQDTEILQRQGQDTQILNSQDSQILQREDSKNQILNKQDTHFLHEQNSERFEVNHLRIQNSDERFPERPQRFLQSEDMNNENEVNDLNNEQQRRLQFRHLNREDDSLENAENEPQEIFFQPNIEDNLHDQNPDQTLPLKDNSSKASKHLLAAAEGEYNNFEKSELSAVAVDNSDRQQKLSDKENLPPREKQQTFDEQQIHRVETFIVNIDTEEGENRGSANHNNNPGSRDTNLQPLNTGSQKYRSQEVQGVRKIFPTLYPSNLKSQNYLHVREIDSSKTFQSQELIQQRGVDRINNFQIQFNQNREGEDNRNNPVLEVNIDHGKKDEDWEANEDMSLEHLIVASSKNSHRKPYDAEQQNEIQNQINQNVQNNQNQLQDDNLHNSNVQNNQIHNQNYLQNNQNRLLNNENIVQNNQNNVQNIEQNDQINAQNNRLLYLRQQKEAEAANRRQAILQQKQEQMQTTRDPLLPDLTTRPPPPNHLRQAELRLSLQMRKKHKAGMFQNPQYQNQQIPLENQQYQKNPLQKQPNLLQNQQFQNQPNSLQNQQYQNQPIPLQNQLPLLPNNQRTFQNQQRTLQNHPEILQRSKRTVQVLPRAVPDQQFRKSSKTFQKQPRIYQRVPSQNRFQKPPPPPLQQQRRSQNTLR